jgi:hypothetical protein
VTLSKSKVDEEFNIYYLTRPLDQFKDAMEELTRKLKPEAGIQISSISWITFVAVERSLGL